MKVAVAGAGKIGHTVAEMLAESGDFDVTLLDHNRVALAARPLGGARTAVVDVADKSALYGLLSDAEVVISALPHFLEATVAEAAVAAHVHYFNLTEDMPTAKRIQTLAAGADRLFVPQCGLAPGFVAIVASHLVQQFDEVHEVRLRVGALPQYPDNALKYNLTWSVDGLINEYCNPCEAIHDGAIVHTPPLEGLEDFLLDGVRYEAFSTSGGVGTLCESLLGRVRTLNYKTIRYPGHRDRIWMLARDLRLCQRREVFKDVIEHAVPVTRQDVVLIFVTVTGLRDGLLSQESFVRRIYGDGTPHGRSAIQKTTASGVCALVDLLREGNLPSRGFLRQEEVALADVLENRFGQVYA